MNIFKKILTTALVTTALVVNVSAQDAQEPPAHPSPEPHAVQLNTPTVEVNKIGNLWVLHYDGSIVSNTATLVKNELDKNPKIKTIILSSNGGVLNAGFELGYLLKERNIQAIVEPGKVCLSSCAFAFMGSKNGIISGQVGFHRPYLPNINTLKLSDDLTSGSMITGMRITAYFTDMRFKPSIGAEILQITDRSTFIVYDRSSDLRLWKFDENTNIENLFTFHDLSMKRSLYKRLISYNRIQFVQERQKEAR